MIIFSCGQIAPHRRSHSRMHSSSPGKGTPGLFWPYRVSHQESLWNLAFSQPARLTSTHESARFAFSSHFLSPGLRIMQTEPAGMSHSPVSFLSFALLVSESRLFAYSSKENFQFQNGSDSQATPHTKAQFLRTQLLSQSNFTHILVALTRWSSRRVK